MMAGGGGRSLNNQSYRPPPGAANEDDNGEVEDGSRGEEGGCREYNFMEEEIELNSGNLSGGIGSHHTLHNLHHH